MHSIIHSLIPIIITIAISMSAQISASTMDMEKATSSEKAIIFQETSKSQISKTFRSSSIQTIKASLVQPFPCSNGPNGGGLGKFNKLYFEDGCETHVNCTIQIERKYDGFFDFIPDKNYTKSMTLNITALPALEPNQTILNPTALLTTAIFYKDVFEQNKNQNIQYDFTFSQKTFYQKHGIYQIELRLTSETNQTVICQMFPVKLNGNGAGVIGLISFIMLMAQQMFLFSI